MILHSFITLALLVICTVLAAPQQNAYNTNYNQNPFNRRPTPNYNQPQQQPSIYPQTLRNFIPITSYQNDVNFDGSFQYSYTSGDGSQQQARGYVKNLGQKDAEAQVVQGSYSYTSPDGTPITVTYIADENGYRAEGAHLPTPPPIPEAIAKSLQYNRVAQQPQLQAQSLFQRNNQYNNQQGAYNKFGQYK